jgi:hypothetical protein
MNGSLAAAIRGPLMLIALGAVLAADQMEVISLRRTWPLLLILFGLLELAEHLSAGMRRPKERPEAGQGGV